MIKLTTTQAKAVAAKIRERLFDHNEKVKKEIEEKYKGSDEYKNKQREIHEAVITLWQTSLKTGLIFGINVSGYYSSHYIYSEDDLKSVEEHLVNNLVRDYVNKNDTTNRVPDEDKLVTDLIFESLTSDGIEELMNKFIQQYI